MWETDQKLQSRQECPIFALQNGRAQHLYSKADSVTRQISYHLTFSSCQNVSTYFFLWQMYFFSLLSVLLGIAPMILLVQAWVAPWLLGFIQGEVDEFSLPSRSPAASLPMLNTAEAISALLHRSVAISIGLNGPSTKSPNIFPG